MRLDGNQGVGERPEEPEVIRRSACQRGECYDVGQILPSGLASGCPAEASTPIGGIRIWTGGDALGAAAPPGEGSPLEPTSAGTTEGATCRMLAGDEVGGLVAGEADRVVAAPPHPVLTA